MSRPTGCEDYVLQLLQILEELPDVRQDKVAKLRKQIQQGSYRWMPVGLRNGCWKRRLKDILYRTGKNVN